MGRILYIIAGANGSGKSTFGVEFSKERKVDFLNVDDMVNLENKDNISAGKRFLKLVKNNLLEGKSIALETTMSGRYLINILSEAKSLSYKIVIIYIFLENFLENIIRVRNLVLLGGHDVPEDDIIRRYKRSFKMFWNIYKNLADEYFIFYNGNDRFDLVADCYHVYNDELMAKFLIEVKN